MEEKSTPQPSPYFTRFLNRTPPTINDQTALSRTVWQLLASATICLGFIYLSWRWTESLNADALLFSIAVVLAETLTFLGSCLFFYDIWQEGDTQQRPWNEVRNTEPFRQNPTHVDVFITTLDEADNILTPAIVAAQNLASCQNVETTIYVLDDGNRRHVRRLAEKLGVRYLSRTSNRGYKAGNLTQALYQTRGDFIIICDADTPGPLRLDVVETQEVLERRLALALARHALNAQQNALEIEFAEQRQEFEETRLSLAADIGSELAEVDKTRARLSHLIKAPRIQAPVAGRILRLRHVTPQKVLPQDTEVLSILPSQNDGYRIAFSAEPADLSFLKIGQDVHIDILGLPQKALTLDAKINEIATDGPNRVAMSAQVSQASQAVLAKSPYSQQIRDASSAVAIRAYRQDTSLINLFRTTSKDLLPETLWWRTAQTSSETALERSAQTWVFPKPQLPLDLF